MVFIVDWFYALFELSPLLAIGVVAFLVTLLTNVVTKYTTDQEKIKRLKDEMSDLQDEMKEAGDDPETMQDIQSEIWPKQKELMMNSMKPFLYYGIPLLLVFGWLSQTIAYQPINPGEDFAVTAFTDDEAPDLSLETPSTVQNTVNELYDPGEDQTATQWTLRANQSGTYNVSVVPEGTDQSYSHQVLVTDGYGYGQVETTIQDSQVNRIRTGYQATPPFGSFSVLGYQPGWLATYILLSLVFNLVLRKLLNVA